MSHSNSFVSIIIPVFNNKDGLKRVLEGILNQSNPLTHCEIIVIDNGSVDSPKDIINSFSRKMDITFLEETDHLNSPYAARNKGIKHSKGDIIVLLDTTCVPSKDWLKSGLSLLKLETDLVAGNIRFKFNQKIKASDLAEAITFNNNRNIVKNENGAQAGNLFVSRKVFDKTGLFPSQFRSGMDIWWTQQAHKTGFKLKFSSKAVVYCYPRNWKKIMSKSYRVGTMHPFNMTQNGFSKMKIFLESLKTFSPPKIEKNRKRLHELKYDLSTSKFLTVWFICWQIKIMMAIGRLRGLLSLKSQLKLNQ